MIVPPLLTNPDVTSPSANGRGMMSVQATAADAAHRILASAGIVAFDGDVFVH